MLDFITQRLVDTNEIDYDYFGNEAYSSGRGKGSVLVAPSKKIYNNLLANVLAEEQALLFFSSSRRVMVKLMRDWGNHMQGKWGVKNYIATKAQLGIICGEYGSSVPVMPAALRYLISQPLVMKHNATVEFTKLKAKAYGVSKNRFTNVTLVKTEYTWKEAQTDTFLSGLDKGGYFCYVGRPNPKMEIVLQHSSKKAFTLLDIASFINNQG
ncbi:hypothetical protein [Acidiphilium sp. JA12-A1]|uniref:hypothetical protein n=1 Tax=Acidiphilium sp. JA12-A1 TaxID=1464546 RepID=UPI000460AB1F|nr:hypothetical protein [Acidiphilium sp. JA12-A1]KDM68754.1 hypothetical protein ACIDI_1c00110 [Acidiphilium sp. JA12-A1]